VRRRPPRPARDEVPVRAEMCETCIFRPGDVMRLAPGRVEEMVRSVRMSGSYIPCHETMHMRRRGLTKPACRGLYDLHPDQAVFQLADRIAGGLVFVDADGVVTGRP
jgi:hypothetical protein